MTERAARLVDGVLPHVPVRQWVLSLPHRLRYRLPWDHHLCRTVLGVFIRALLEFYRRQVRQYGVGNGHTGTLTVIQRFGGGLNLNIHFPHPRPRRGVQRGHDRNQFEPLPSCR